MKMPYQGEEILKLVGFPTNGLSLGSIKAQTGPRNPLPAGSGGLLVCPSC